MSYLKGVMCNFHRKITALINSGTNPDTSNTSDLETVGRSYILTCLECSMHNRQCLSSVSDLGVTLDQ